MSGMTSLLLFRDRIEQSASGLLLQKMLLDQRQAEVVVEFRDDELNKQNPTNTLSASQISNTMLERLY